MIKLPEDVIINNTSYSTNNSILIPKNQNKTRLIKAMFEKRKKFKVRGRKNNWPYCKYFINSINCDIWSYFYFKTFSEL